MCTFLFSDRKVRHAPSSLRPGLNDGKPRVCQPKWAAILGPRQTTAFEGVLRRRLTVKRPRRRSGRDRHRDHSGHVEVCPIPVGAPYDAAQHGGNRSPARLQQGVATNNVLLVVADLRCRGRQRTGRKGPGRDGEAYQPPKVQQALRSPLAMAPNG